MGPAYLMYSNKDSNAESEFMAARPSESSFLQLPVEIRLEIYRYLLSSKYIRRKIPYQVSLSDIPSRACYHSSIVRYLLTSTVQTGWQVRNHLLYIPFPQTNPAHKPPGPPRGHILLPSGKSIPPLHHQPPRGPAHSLGVARSSLPNARRPCWLFQALCYGNQPRL